METLPEQTRIYYTGDQANPDGFGTIAKSYSNRWGDFYDLVMDDGRKINALHTCAFSPTYSGNGSTRFVTKDAYHAYHNEKTQQFIKNAAAGNPDDTAAQAARRLLEAIA